MIRRIVTEVREDRLTTVAAAVAFWGMLAVFPALILAASVYGLVADPADIARHIRTVSDAAPPGVAELITNQLERVAAVRNADLTLGLWVSLAALLWAASRGTRAVITAINIAYDATETRGFVSRRLRSLALTLVGVTAMVAAFAVVAAGSWVFRALGLESFARGAFTVMRWPILAAVTLLGLAVLYRFAPDRDGVRWRWVTRGSAFATLAWVAASIGLSVYLSSTGDTRGRGEPEAVLALMLWLYITALAIIVGAEIDAEYDSRVMIDA